MGGILVDSGISHVNMSSASSFVRAAITTLPLTQVVPLFFSLRQRCTEKPFCTKKALTEIPARVFGTLYSIFIFYFTVKVGNEAEHQIEENCDNRGKSHSL